MTLEWWHWEIAGLALVLLELAVPAFFVIWFGFGALLVGLALLAYAVSSSHPRMSAKTSTLPLK